MKRIISAILLFALVGALASCSLEEGRVVSASPSPTAGSAATLAEPPMPAEELGETVMTIDGDGVTMAEVRYQAASLMSAYEFFGEGNVDFSAELEGKPAGDFFIDEAVNTCILFRAVERYAAENGYAFTEQEYDDIYAEINEYIEQCGGQEAFNEQLEYAGMTPSLYEYLVEVPRLYYKMYDAIYGEGGEQEITDETVHSYFEQNYMTTRHILKVALDDNGDPLPEADAEKVRAEAEALAERAASGEDFASLAAAESDDDELLGETITFELSTMPDEYVAAAEALAPGETSGTVDIGGAYVIILREELDEGYLDENFDAVSEEYGLTQFRVYLDAVCETLPVEKTDAFAKVDPEEIYNAFFG